MNAQIPDQLARDVEDARHALNALGVAYAAFDLQEVVRSARIYMDEGWRRAEAFTVAARLVLGGRVAALPSPLAGLSPTR